MTNIYVDLTHQFNAGRTRAILSSGQAVVVHRLAIMSKDGDWIVREDDESTRHILGVLAAHGARYRFGAPFDQRWLCGGWSSHFEFTYDGLRVRTDFVSRPPRIARDDLEALWAEQEEADLAVVDVRRLAELKKTNRERDYSVIGELARIMRDPAEQMRYSRSARDLVELCARFPESCRALMKERTVLAHAREGREALEVALDAERRKLIHANEQRLLRYTRAATAWSSLWKRVAGEVADLPLERAHEIIVRRAEGALPYGPGDE